MKKTIKHLISLVGLVFFLILAAGSSGDDASSGTSLEDQRELERIQRKAADYLTK